MKEVLDYFFCHRCDSKNLEKIDRFQGKPVVPEPLDENITWFNQRGVVLKCKDCGEITGYLITPRGVVDEEASA